MPKYATQTTVSVASSKAEIEAVLRRYGADAFAHGWDADHAHIGFRIDNRQVRIFLPLPDPNAREITHTEQGKERVESSRQSAYEQACRQRWRALLLVIKAKLEAVECGISTIEREFLSSIILPNGMTVGDWAEPQLREMYLSKQMPALLPGLERKAIAE